MALSGSTNFTTTAQEVIEDALRDLGVIREDQSVQPGDAQKAMRTLNRMVKLLQVPDIHLWKRALVTVFLQKDQTSYIISSTSTDHATENYTKTSLDADYASGVGQVSFNDTVTASIGDYIGIVLDDNSIYWDTISNVVDPNTVDLTGTLSGDASENADVYIYTTKADVPFNVYDAIRKNDSDIDVPMFQMSYTEYFDQPNKTTASTAVNYMYDRQKDFTRIYVWPTPADVEYRMQLSINKKIEDLDSVSNNLDFPQEWEEAIVSNLALRLGPAFGKAGDPNFAEIKDQAAKSLLAAFQFDSEQGSLSLQPDFHR